MKNRDLLNSGGEGYIVACLYAQDNQGSKAVMV